MNRFTLGVVLEAFNLPLRPALDRASKLGVRAVQVDAAGDLAPDRLGESGRKEFRHLLTMHNLRLAALNCPLRRGLDVAENQGQRIDHVRGVMKLAYDLGAGLVVAPLPKVPTDPAAPRAVTLRDALRDLGAFGDRIGSRLALEAGLDPGDAVRDYLATFDTGGLAVTFDPANFLLNGHDPLTSLAALAGRVAHAHARDAKTATVSGAAVEVAVGAGDVEWLALVATLASIDYAGTLAVDRETGDRRAADVAAGVEYLRRFA